ncbi:MAG: capsular biosynthesis protein [Pseudomonadales bacterium]|nr:capsular biosynthesis protein [Pseudomonadales bacterium]
MIDIHNHYLAGVDDGAETLADSMALVRLAVEQGIKKVVCTPHYHHGRYDWQQDKVTAAFTELQQAVADDGLPIALACAAEVRFSDEILIDLKQAKIPFIGLWQGREALLLELPHGQVPMGVDVFLKWLLKEGIQPIIAHPERNKSIMRDVRRADELVKAGALFQLTAGSVVGDFGEAAKKVSEYLLAQGSVQFIASDAHNLKRAPAMAEAAVVLQDFAAASLPGGAEAGQELVQMLMHENPESLTQSLFTVAAG